MTHSLARAPSALPRLSRADFIKPNNSPATSQVLTSSDWLLKSQSPPCQARTANEWTGTRMPVSSLSAPAASRIIHSPQQSSIIPQTSHPSLRTPPHSRSHLCVLPRTTGRISLRTRILDSSTAEDASEVRDTVLVLYRGRLAGLLGKVSANSKPPGWRPKEHGGPPKRMT